MRKRPHWTDKLVDELAQEAWQAMPQDWMNRLFDSMPSRLQDVIDSGGQMVVPRPRK